MILGRVLARGQVTLPRSIRLTAGVEPGDAVTFEVTGPGTVQISVLPRLRLAEALQRYRVEGPVDEPADRAKWQERASREIMGIAHG